MKLKFLKNQNQSDWRKFTGSLMTYVLFSGNCVLHIINVILSGASECFVVIWSTTLGSLSSTTGSLNFGPVDILAWMVLFCRFFPVHRCLAASLISAHKMSVAPTSPPVTTVNNVSSVPWAKGGKGGKISRIWELPICYHCPSGTFRSLSVPVLSFTNIFPSYHHTVFL